MSTNELNRRSVRSVTDALVLASGAVATAFGIAAVAHILFHVFHAVRAIADAI